MSGALRVAVGSANRAKLLAVERGLASFFASLDVRAVDVASGVPEQPIGIEEIVAGARNRAERSYATAGCDLAAGIEDGLIPVADVPAGFMNVGCCVLFDGAQHGIGLTAGFEYPPACVTVAVGPPRTPIGDVFDDRFEKVYAHAPPSVERRDGASSLSKRVGALRGDTSAASAAGAGNIGRLTLGVLPRSSYGEQAVICALVRLLHPALYADGGEAAP
jgi:inosine/xanthosine triphosphatase